MGTIECDTCNCCSPPGLPPCSPGCCKCPPSGDVCFDILDCQAYYLFEDPATLQDNWAPVDSCCTGMSFTLTHALGYPMCIEPGHAPSTVDPGDGSTCLSTGTGPGMPTGTGTGELPELWGFSGTVCGDCTTGPSRPAGMNPMEGWSPPDAYWRAEDCGGMCLKASLCCCKAPYSGGSSIGQGNRCAGGAALPERSSDCACGVTCYKFTMAPFDCHELPKTLLCDVALGDEYCQGETFMSACSPCSFLEGPSASSVHPEILPPLCPYTGCDWNCGMFADTTGASMGIWNVWDSCPPAIARGTDECGVIPYTGSSSCSGSCPNSSGSRNFMVLVEGVYESQCDCAVGVMDVMCVPQDPPTPGAPVYLPSGVGFMKSVFVKFTALLSEC